MDLVPIAESESARDRVSSRMPGTFDILLANPARIHAEGGCVRICRTARDPLIHGITRVRVLA